MQPYAQYKISPSVYVSLLKLVHHDVDPDRKPQEPPPLFDYDGSLVYESGLRFELVCTYVLLNISTWIQTTPNAPKPPQPNCISSQ